MGSGSNWAAGTDVSAWLGSLIALVLTAIFLTLMIPLKGYRLGDLFLDRGWVPYVLVFLMSWSVAILFLKSRKLARQKKSMLFDLLPTDLADEITEKTLDRFVRYIRGLPVEPGGSFLVNRVLRGLEHFRARKSNPEVASMLASQSEIDATAVESSYTLLKVFIWAIPILGFIGTVMGISDAVSGFSGSLETAQDIGVLKESLNGVTGGLAMAFDTTLVALVMSLFVMFPTSSMQKAEEDLLNWVDEYCNENLLKRLDDGGGKIGPLGGAGTDVNRAVDAAMAAQRVEMETWTKTLRSIGSTLTEQVVKGWGEINDQLLSQQRQRESHLRELEQAAADFRQAMADLTQKAAAVQQHVAGPMSGAAEALTNRYENVERGLDNLSRVLDRIAQKDAVIRAPKRRRWRWFGGSDERQ